MKSIRFRLLIAAMAVMLGSVLAKSQAAADAPPPPPMHGHAHGFGADGHGMHFMAKYLNLTDEQKTIVEYWADGPGTGLPPGHWALFAQQVSQREGYGIDDDAKMFFALTNAMFDASIAVWDCKRVFDYVRPITAIRFAI